MLEKDYARLDFSLIVSLLILVLDANLRESLFFLSSLFRSLYNLPFSRIPFFKSPFLYSFLLFKFQQHRDSLLT